MQNNIDAQRGGLIAHLGNVVALDVAHAVEREISGEGHGEVVAKGQQLAALVRQVVDELRVLAVLPCKRLLTTQARHRNARLAM